MANEADAPTAKAPLLSIVTICLNGVDYIERTLSSVTRQLTSEVEYLVVDGASVDGTEDVVRQHTGRIDRFVSEPDTGLYNAINKGVRLAKGRYVGLVHGGDVLRPGALATVLSKIAAPYRAVLYGGISTYKDGRFLGLVGPHAGVLPEQMIPHPATFVPKELYELYGFYDESYRIAADYKLFLNLYLKGVEFVWIDGLVVDFDLSGVSSRWDEAQKEISRLKVELGVARPQGRVSPVKTKLRRLYEALADLLPIRR